MFSPHPRPAPLLTVLLPISHTARPQIFEQDRALLVSFGVEPLAQELAKPIRTYT